MAYAKFKTEVADKEFPGIENISNEVFWKQMTRTKKRYCEFKRADGRSQVTNEEDYEDKIYARYLSMGIARMKYAKFKTEVADKEFPGIENMST